MSESSPIFVSAIELLAHSTDLYRIEDERKLRYVILHLANAIELILKDCLIDHGISIYYPKKRTTLTVWDCLQKLEKLSVKIHERPIIEILIDDRNTIQHKYGFPNSETVFFYLQHVVSFFARFLSEHYSAALSDHLALYLGEEDLVFLGLRKDKEDYSSLDSLFKISPDAAVLQAFGLIEKRFSDVLAPLRDHSPRASVFRDPSFSSLLDDLMLNGYVPNVISDNFGILRNMRNRAAHGGYATEPGDADWSRALTIAKEILIALDHASSGGFLEEWVSHRSTNSQPPMHDQGGSESSSGTAIVDDETA